MFEPSGLANGHLDLASEPSLGIVDRVVERVTVRRPQDEEVDIPDRPHAAFASVASCPRTEDQCLVDPVNGANGIPSTAGTSKAFVSTSASPP